jgi:tripartite motif-containing protein 71
VAVDCNGLLTVTDSDNNRVQQFALAAPPATGCGQLGPLGTPPAPQVPTLPAPDGPQVTLRALRTTKLLRSRVLPLRIGCDTTCALQVSATVAPRARPRKGHKPVSEIIRTVTMTVPAGESRIVRLTLSRAKARHLQRALGARIGLVVTVQLTATAAVGAPTELTSRLPATG